MVGRLVRIGEHMLLGHFECYVVECLVEGKLRHRHDPRLNLHAEVLIKSILVALNNFLQISNFHGEEWLDLLD